MAKPLKILSCGAGIQSSTLLLMSIKGALPRVDCAIFADPQWEGAATYEHLAWLTAESEAAGIPLYRVTAGDIKRHLETGFAAGQHRFASLPLHILNVDGSRSMVPRQCTREFKIQPINAFIRTELLGLKPRARWPTEPVVDQWFGISSDEAQRMRDPAPNEQWKRHVYPLCGVPELMLGRTFSRSACVAWLAENYPGRRSMPASSCVGCPFHSQARWREMKATAPGDWAEAVEMDAKIRKGHEMNGEAFLHRSCVPLADAVLTDDAQLDLGFGEECMGYCGN